MLSVGDVYCYYIRDFGQYGACQILDIKGERISNVVLDILKKVPINLNDLNNIRPLAHGGYYYHQNNSVHNMPTSYIYVGNVDPILTEPTDLNVRQWPDGIEHIEMKEWDEIPEEESEAFEKYAYDPTPVVIGSRTYPRNHRHIDDDLLDEIKDYSELDALPCLDGVYINRYYEGLFSYLQTRHLVRELYMMNHNPPCLDLRDSCFIQVGLNITGIHTLYLNDRTRKFVITGKAEPDFKIVEKSNGARTYINYCVKSNKISSYGLREIKDLTLHDFHELDALVLAEEFPNLRSLFLKGSPGIVRNLGQLCKLITLEDINIIDVFGFASEELAPFLELNNLYRFWMSNVPEEPGKYARKAFKNKVKDLSITKLRKPEWIIENANNPFRAWDGDEGVPSGAYKKACLFYKDLKKDILAASDREGILLAVKNYTEAFNQLDKRYKNFIETTQAEDLFQVVENLYEEKLAGKDIVSIEAVRQVMEESRKW